MSLTVDPLPIPVTFTPEGVARVSGTRVTLDTIIGAFLDGASADEIYQQYPSVPLGDVYALIGYYLHNREVVDLYLARQRAEADQVQAENERRFDPSGLRARLLARRVPSQS